MDSHLVIAGRVEHGFRLPDARLDQLLQQRPPLFDPQLLFAVWLEAGRWRAAGFRDPVDIVRYCRDAPTPPTQLL